MCAVFCGESAPLEQYYYTVHKKKRIFLMLQLVASALWVGYRIDPLPCHACRKRRLRQEQLAPRIKGLV